jgi:hypothetical protein
MDSSNNRGKGTGEDWDAKIIAHSWKDKNFLRKLIANPEQTLREFGCPYPENMRINIIEEKPNEYTLVIPQPPVAVNKLNEAQLVQAAGGSPPTGHFGDSLGPDCCR